MDALCYICYIKTIIKLTIQASDLVAVSDSNSKCCSGFHSVRLATSEHNYNNAYIEILYMSYVRNYPTTDFDIHKGWKDIKTRVQ